MTRLLPILMIALVTFGLAWTDVAGPARSVAAPDPTETALSSPLDPAGTDDRLTAAAAGGAAPTVETLTPTPVTAPWTQAAGMLAALLIGATAAYRARAAWPCRRTTPARS